MTRTGVAMVIRHVRETTDAGTVTALYGPFLPHGGSALTTMLWTLDNEAEANSRVISHDSYVEGVFIGANESDALVSPR